MGLEVTLCNTCRERCEALAVCEVEALQLDALSEPLGKRAQLFAESEIQSFEISQLSEPFWHYNQL